MNRKTIIFIVVFLVVVLVFAIIYLTSKSNQEAPPAKVTTQQTTGLGNILSNIPPGAIGPLLGLI